MNFVVSRLPGVKNSDVWTGQQEWTRKEIIKSARREIAKGELYGGHRIKKYCYYDFKRGRRDQLLSQLLNIGILCSCCCFSLHFECRGCYKGALARDVGWHK